MVDFPQSDGYVGQRDITDGLNLYNVISFIIQQALAGIGTAIPVVVKSVIAPVANLAPPAVNVQPLVNQIDGYGAEVPHGVIYDVPIFRLQCGPSAIIMDPLPGDNGVCVFAMRDISAVKQNGGISSPGSRRKFDFSDGMYFGGILNPAPSQYMQFYSTGITILDINGNIIRMSPTGIDLN